jgi:hypothetical protein
VLDDSRVGSTSIEHGVLDDSRVGSTSIEHGVLDDSKVGSTSIEQGVGSAYAAAAVIRAIVVNSFEADGMVEIFFYRQFTPIFGARS